MPRPILRLAALAALPWLTAAAFAAPAPPGPLPKDRVTPESHPRPMPQEMQSIGVDRMLTTFAGTVLDVHERPVANAQIKLFVDGGLVAAALTEANGYYEMRALYDPSDDLTVLLWIVPRDRGLMAKEIVIQESRTSRSHGLISPCVPRATIAPRTQFRVYVFDAATRNKELAELNCLP